LRPREGRSANVTRAIGMASRASTSANTVSMAGRKLSEARGGIKHAGRVPGPKGLDGAEPA
jgi:hypothetical protein